MSEKSRTFRVRIVASTAFAAAAISASGRLRVQTASPRLGSPSSGLERRLRTRLDELEWTQERDQDRIGISPRTCRHLACHDLVDIDRGAFLPETGQAEMGFWQTTQVVDEERRVQDDPHVKTPGLDR